MFMDYHSFIREYIEQEKNALTMVSINDLVKATELLIKTQKSGGTIYTFGNGGSAATASHFQNDFNKGISEHTECKFNFFCLVDNIATVTAIANDISYDEIFRFQLQGRLHKNDIALAISGSGNSKNVILAAEYIKQQGNKVIGLTGYDGGQLKLISDISLHVPVNSMQITEDVHMVFNHMIMAILYSAECEINHLKR